MLDEEPGQIANVARFSHRLGQPAEHVPCVVGFPKIPTVEGSEQPMPQRKRGGGSHSHAAMAKNRHPLSRRPKGFLTVHVQEDNARGERKGDE